MFLLSFFFLVSFSIECWLTKPFSYLFSKLCKCIKIFLSRDDYVNERCNNTDKIKIIKSVIIFQGMLLYLSSWLSVQVADVSERTGTEDWICIQRE